MSEIRLPGQPHGNPLTTLAGALATTNIHLAAMAAQMVTTNRHLSAISENTRKEDRHIYVVSERKDGAWGTYCLACSDRAQDYVYPCEKYAEVDHIPPNFFGGDPVV